MTKKTPLFHINRIKYLYNGEDLNNINKGKKAFRFLMLVCLRKL